MPRKTLYSRPPRLNRPRQNSSGRPANRPPIMTVLAAAIALATSRVADAAVGDQGDAGGLGGLGAVEDGGELGDADAGDLAGGAGEPGADADLDGVGAGIGQVAEAVGGGHVAGHDLAVRPGRLQLRDGVDGGDPAWPWATSTTRASTSTSAGPGRGPGSRRAPRGRPPPRSRPWPSRVAWGQRSRRPMSRSVISPASRPSSATRGSFSIRWRSSSLRASSRSMPGRADQPLGRGHRPATVSPPSARMSRAVRMPIGRRSASTTTRPVTPTAWPRRRPRPPSAPGRWCRAARSPGPGSA